MKQYIHAFPVQAEQIEKDEIFNINAVDKKAYVGDWLITYEDGTRAILTREEAKAQLKCPINGHIEDNSHIVTEEDLVEFKKMGVTGVSLGDVIIVKESELKDPEQGDDEQTETTPAEILNQEGLPSSNGALHEDEKPAE